MKEEYNLENGFYIKHSDIEMLKAGSITDKVLIPTTCPCCASILERVKDQLFCRNPNCDETQQKKVVNYAKVMKIKGLGDKTVEKLGIRTIPDIYSLNLSVAAATIGDKMAAKLIGEIENSKRTTIDKFVAACSIPLIGQTAGTKLATVINNPFDISFENCKKAGLGDKASTNLVNWFVTEFMDNLSTLPIDFVESTKTMDGSITVCITGKIPGYTKSKLASELANYGVNVVDNVSKKIDYLVCNARKNSTKERKATELGIKILTLDELIKEIN